jgi:hypothetical protein
MISTNFIQTQRQNWTISAPVKPIKSLTKNVKSTSWASDYLGYLSSKFEYFLSGFAYELTPSRTRRALLISHLIFQCWVFHQWEKCELLFITIYMHTAMSTIGGFSLTNNDWRNRKMSYFADLINVIDRKK